MGWSVFQGIGSRWKRFRLRPPPGIAVLWGDPAMTRLGNTVFYSNVASAKNAWDAVHKVGSSNCGGFCDDCVVWTSTERPTPGGGACIALITPGKSFVPNGRLRDPEVHMQCIRNGLDGPSGANDFYDGGSMAATSARVYAAYNNHGNVDIWSRGFGRFSKRFKQLSRPP
jgi:hypothetical protein